MEVFANAVVKALNFFVVLLKLEPEKAWPEILLQLFQHFFIGLMKPLTMQIINYTCAI